MKNRFAGACVVCGEHVPENTGDLSGPPWKLKCLPCSGKPKEQALFIDVKRVVTGEISFRPSSFLDRELFEKYREMTKGTQYNGEANLAKLDKALWHIASLEKGGFTLRIAPEVSASLQAFVAKSKEIVGQARTRADQVDASLRERGLALFPFQPIGVEFLATHAIALLMDDMGLGKTIQALIAIPDDGAVLVTGPVAALSVWADETAKWRPDLKFQVIENKNAFRWPNQGEMLFVTYSNLPENLPQNARPGDGTTLIGDEAHALKNANVKRTKRFRNLSQAVRALAGSTWLLTATPLHNHPMELWNILQAAGAAKEVFGSFYRYQQLYNCKQGPWGETIWGLPSPEVPELLRKVSIRREKKDVLTELPEKIRRQVKVSLGPEWDAALNKLIDELNTSSPSIWDWLRAELNTSSPSIWDWLRAGPEVYEDVLGDRVSKPSVSAREIITARADLLAMRGRANAFQHMSRARELLAKAKIPALLEIIEEFEEQEEPVIVFSDHRAPIDALANRKGWAVITGDVSAKERQRIASEFQDGKFKGIALTIDAGGVAITLTRASNEIFVDQSFNPAINDQAEDRAVRIGQTRGVVIQQLVADHPLDKRLHEILREKRQLIRHSIEASTITPETRPAVPAVLEQPTVDFERLEAEALQKAEADALAAQEARKLAEERAKESAERLAKAAKEAEDAKIRERLAKRYAQALQRARERGWVEDDNHPERHPPLTEAEKWASQALTELSLLDPDRARERNNVGFNKSDGYVGHWFAQELPKGLTPRQWQAAIDLCRPYHRQIGPCPQENENATV